MVFEVEFGAAPLSHPVASQECAGIIWEDLSFFFEVIFFFQKAGLILTKLPKPPLCPHIHKEYIVHVPSVL